MTKQIVMMIINKHTATDSEQEKRKESLASSIGLRKKETN
jgi:hypothetical protein